MRHFTTAFRNMCALTAVVVLGLGGAATVAVTQPADVPVTVASTDTGWGAPGHA